MFGFVPRFLFRLSCGAIFLFAAQGASFAADSTPQPVAGDWSSDCLPEACALSLTLGATDEAGGGIEPDGKAVQITVEVNRKSRKVDLIILTVPPDADQGRGIITSFAKSVPYGDTFKTVADRETLLQLGFDNCEEDNCETYLKEGKVSLDKGATFDLKDNLFKQDVFLVGFYRGNTLVRQTTALSSFKRDYDALLAKMKTAH